MPLNKIPKAGLQPHQLGQTPMPAEDPPPTYVDTIQRDTSALAPARSTDADHASESPAGLAREYALTPPSDAQKSEAPLKIVQSHTPIKGSFLLFNGRSHERPDALLKSTHSRVSVALWVEGEWGRPVVIDVSNSHSSIDFSIHTLVEPQPIELTAKTSHGSINIALPPSFHGVIHLTTSHSTAELSRELQANSVRFSPPGKSADTASYRVGGPNGSSVVDLKTSHAKLEVAYTTDEKVLEREKNAERDYSCQLM